MFHSARPTTVAATGALALALGLGLASGVTGSAPARAQDASQTASLVAYEVVDGIAISEPLTDQPGDPEQGKAVAINRELGNCLACHHMPIPEEEFHGETGPSLWGVANRLTTAEIRLRLVDAKKMNPETMMPGFYVVDDLRRVPKEFQGKPILTAQQIEDVLAYLATFTVDEPS